jgi:enediyne biosynthesis protein E4
LKAGGVTRIREVRSGGSYQSHSDFRLHFGLGSTARIDEIAVRWPGGRIQKLENVTADRILEIEEPPE